MGKHRFRLSDMMPNTWFYKLKDMGRTRNQNSNQARRKKHPPTTSSSTTTTTTTISTSSSASSLSTANNAIQQQPHQPTDLLSHQRKSYYFTRDLTPPPLPPSPPTYPTESNNNNTHPDHLPRKSQKQNRSSRRNRVSTKTPSKLVTSSSSSVPAGCSCRPTADSVWNKPDSTSVEYTNSPLDSSSDLQSLVPEFGSDHDPALHSDSSNGTVQCSDSCHCSVEKDIVINVNVQSLDPKFDGFELPPIITQKPSTRKDAIQEIKKKKKKRKDDCDDPTILGKISAKSEDRNASGSLSVKVAKEEQRTSLVRRLSVSSPGLRLRTNSPRIASKKIQAHARKSVSSSTTSRRSLSESFAVMKSSADPQRDFRESMVEMILENNIRASKDLEDLLASYLQLNSDEYHQLIIKVFKQIWFDLAGVKLK